MDYIKKELDLLKDQGLFRDLKVIDSPQEAKVIIEGRSVINLCSNNYLGLCNDSRLKISANTTIKKYGFGSGASRLVSGNMLMHKRLEEKIASFKKTESALLFNSGYCANLGIISSLVGKDDIIFSDRLNHASIIDAITLSRAKLKRYPHKDVNTLELFIKKSTGFRRRLIVSDSVFSMDGDIAPLDKILALAKKYDCFVFVDDAHATGVLGNSGRGSLEHFGLDDTNLVIQMGTLSKAVGSFGAYVCGSKSLIDYFINKARSFIFTTALPVSVCAASLAALEIIETDLRLRDRLNKNITFFREKLKDLDFSVSGDPTPIIPLVIGDSRRTLEFSRRLFNKGIFVQAIRPPTVPKGTARLRLTVTALHSAGDLGFALDKIAETAKELGILND